MTIGVFERGGSLGGARAFPLSATARRGCADMACYQGSVLYVLCSVCVHGSSSVHSTRCCLGSCFCSIDVESRLGHVINSRQPPCAPTRKISHTRAQRERRAYCVCWVLCRVCETARHYGQNAMKQCTTESTMLNGACKCQFKWQVPKTRTLALWSLRARAHRHTQLHTERRHTQIAQITVTERARLRSSVG